MGEQGRRAGEIEIRLLGRFAVLVDGEEVPAPAFGGRLVRALLRLLLTRRGTFVAKDVLTEALWPGRAPADPAANLDVLVSRARRALGDPTLVVAGSGGYRFARDDRCTVDVEAFLGNVEAGREALAAGSWERGFALFQAALDRWTGEALAEDAYADWAQAYRAELARAELDALEGAAAAALGAGMATRAVVFAERAVAREPLREAGHVLLARALAASGDAAGALAVIGDFRKRFADELGLDLPQEAAEVELQILRGGPVAASATRPALVRAPGDAPPVLAFVGRDEEMGRLLAALEPPDPAVVTIAGRSGTGKSRLLAEARARIGIPTVAGRAFRPDADEPWSLARAIVEEALSLDVGAAHAISARSAQVLADLVPGLAELRPDLAGEPLVSIDAESRRALLLESCVRIIQQTVGDRAAVFVDDLQWTDPTSLALLALLPRRIAGLGLALAYRPEELARSGTVAAFLDDLSATGPVVRIDIGALPEAAIPDLVADDAIARAIVEETDRSPFAVAEVLRALTEQGAGAPSASGRWQPRSERAAALASDAARRGQREAVLARVRWQPSRRRELVSLLGLLGREVPARVLQSATRADPAALGDDLDTLARAGLARAGDEGWAVGHDLVGDVAVEALEPAERVRLHGLLAEALAQAGAEPAELALHLAAAGDRPGAAEAYLEAGRRALEGFAGDEGATLASRGLAIASDPPVRVGLLEVRAEARTRRGELPEAREDLSAAIAATRSGPDRARLMARLALLTSGASDLARAGDLVDRSLAEAGGDVDARAEALYAGAIVDMNAGAPARASERFAEALELFERAGNARGTADILDGRAMAVLMEGRIADSVEALGRVARLFLDAGELIRFIWPQGALGAALGWMLRGDEGLAAIDEALETARALRHREGECYCLLERALTLATLGRAGDAAACAQEALDIAESLGHAEWTVASLLALGSALLEGGELARARDALHRCLAIAEPRHLTHFTSWAEALLARVLVAQGTLAEAERLVSQALATDTPLAHHYARLAGAELAAARGDPEAQAVAAEALARAEAAGHLDAAAKLRPLASR